MKILILKSAYNILNLKKKIDLMLKKLSKMFNKKKSRKLSKKETKSKSERKLHQLLLKRNKILLKRKKQMMFKELLKQLSKSFFLNRLNSNPKSDHYQIMIERKIDLIHKRRIKDHSQIKRKSLELVH